MSMSTRFKYITFSILTSVTIWLRLVNLGYSDYQGDEIKALFLPTIGQSLINFIFEQRKGPVQFFITYLIKFLDPYYLNEFLVRLPFAISGILSVIIFYKLIEKHFGHKLALYAAFFMSTNGLFVAFSRIVQYQSFVILFGVLSLYFFTLAIKEKKWMILGLYLGMISWAVSMLAHYDGIFIAPFVLYLLFVWYKNFPEVTTKTRLAHLALSSLLVAGIVLSFYVPFFLSVSDKTKDYWLDRLEGGEGKISSSIITFKAYNPKLVFYFYSLLVLFSVYKIYYKHVWKKSWIFVVWFLFPWIIFELVANIPGTHIYTYLIPLFVVLAFGIETIEAFLTKIFKLNVGNVISIIGLVILFSFTSYLSHVVFVDHSREYPWENEKFLVWTLYKPNVIFHLSMFGFPYYRHWEEIGNFVTKSRNNGFYSTNERKSIARYFIPFAKDTDSAGHFVFIKNPQTFANEILQEKALYWSKKYKPDKIFYNNGREVVNIYYMPSGNINTIKSMGY